jgi:Complex I intermediate-associated protein 30 (CIA30)
MHPSSDVIDDLSRNPPLATIGTQWQVVTDQVMGGISSGTLVREIVGGRSAIHMRGNVRLENNGGFVQIGLDLAPGGKTFDGSAWIGIELDVLGNGEEYNVHLRTLDLTRPWQSYRHGFKAATSWQTVGLPFGSFMPHRTDAPLDLRRLRRVGLVAIGRAFSADLALGGIRFFT